MAFCAKCGTPKPTDNDFCPRCGQGAAMQEQAQAPQGYQQQPYQQAPQGYQQQPYQQAPQYPPGAQYPQQPYPGYGMYGPPRPNFMTTLGVGRVIGGFGGGLSVIFSIILMIYVKSASLVGVYFLLSMLAVGVLGFVPPTTSPKMKLSIAVVQIAAGGGWVPMLFILMEAVRGLDGGYMALSFLAMLGGIAALVGGFISVFKSTP